MDRSKVIPLAAVSVIGALAVGCGSSSSSDEPIANGPPRGALTTIPATPVAKPAASRCREPSGQEKFSLRFRVRAHDRELHDEPWALVRKDGVNFMAADVDAADTGLSVPLTVLVSFPQEGRYLSGMKAINGTARTFTDLPVGGDLMPKGGVQALGCLDEER